MLLMVEPNVNLRFVFLNMWESLQVQVKVKSPKNSAVCNHISVCDIIVSFETFLL